MIEKFVPFFDKFGLPRDSKGDPGDQLQRFGMMGLGLKWFYNERVDPHLAHHFEVGLNPPKWVRSPWPGWFHEINRLSRDQTISLIIFFSEFGLKGYLKEFLWAHIKRFGFFTNTRRNGATKENHGVQHYTDAKPLTSWHKFVLKYHVPQFTVPKGHRNYNWKLPDLPGAEFLSIYIRCFDAWYLYPFLVVMDVGTFIGSLLWKYSRKKDNDVLNHMIACEYATRKYPTPLSKWAKKLNDKKQFNRNLKHYFDRVGLHPMAELWQIK